GGRRVVGQIGGHRHRALHSANSRTTVGRALLLLDLSVSPRPALVRLPVRGARWDSLADHPAHARSRFGTHAADPARARSGEESSRAPAAARSGTEARYSAGEPAKIR